MNVSILIIVAVTCGGFCKEASSMPVREREREREYIY